MKERSTTVGVPQKALFWEKDTGTRVKCRLCAHVCVIESGCFGVCGMRKNVHGELLTFAYGETAAVNVDPIEKKPLYHFLPGTYSFSVSTFGCNLRCSFCQNWTISQVNSSKGSSGGRYVEPDKIVSEAVKNNVRSISFTYTEPTVFFEYAYDAGIKAHERGLKNVFVTNGFMTGEVTDKASDFLDAANIDLKSFNNETYIRLCGGRLRPVLDTIVRMFEKGIWVEVTTLLIPGINDSDGELRGIAAFLAGIDRNIPWHISRFHPDYKLDDMSPTPVKDIKRTMDIAYSEGLRYVYPGNVDLGMNTVCPGCGGVLVERGWSSIRVQDGFLAAGKCSQCGEEIKGIWE